MNLLTPLLGSFAFLMATLAVGVYFISADQADRGANVGFFVASAVVFGALTLVSTFFTRNSPSLGSQQVNSHIRLLSVVLISTVAIFIAVLYVIGWWLGKGLTF